MSKRSRSSQQTDQRRRDLLKLAAGGLALGVCGQMPFARAAQPFTPKDASYDGLLTLFFHGAPAQTDTWDPKPGTPSEIVPSFGLGIQDVYGEEVRIANVFTTLRAQLADPNVGLGLVRSLWHPTRQHEAGQRIMSTFWRGALADQYPALAPAMAHYFKGQGIGIPSVVVQGQRTPQRINYVPNGASVPLALNANAQGNQNANPLVQALRLPRGVDAARFGRRRTLIEKLNERFLKARPDEVAKTYRKASDDALQITLQGDAARAFDLSGKPRLPGRNGADAANLTLAQELLKAGIPYVSVTVTGNDAHGSGGFPSITRSVGGCWGTTLDEGVGQMIQNLKATGRRFLIAAYGDFGRTPRVPRSNGRDHWNEGFSAALISVNQPKFKSTAIGDTGPLGLYTRTYRNNGGMPGRLVDPFEPKDLGAFLYRAMGIPVGETAADLPLAEREAPVVDRMNQSSKLLTTFGLA